MDGILEHRRRWSLETARAHQRIQPFALAGAEAADAVDAAALGATKGRVGDEAEPWGNWSGCRMDARAAANSHTSHDRSNLSNHPLGKGKGGSVGSLTKRRTSRFAALDSVPGR